MGKTSRSRSATRTKGRGESALRSEQKVTQSYDAGLAHGKILDQSMIRAHVEAGTCPFCDAGPFKLLARHTNVQHGIGKDELREMAGLYKYQSITSPEFHAALSAARNKQMPSAAVEALSEWRESGKKRVDSEAAKSVRRQILNEHRPSLRDLPIGEKQRRARIMRNANAVKIAEREKRVIDHFTAHPGIGYQEIADSLGFQVEMVRRSLKRAGLYVDGRATRWSK